MTSYDVQKRNLLDEHLSVMFCLVLEQMRMFRVGHTAAGLNSCEGFIYRSGASSCRASEVFLMWWSLSDNTVVSSDLSLFGRCCKGRGEVKGSAKVGVCDALSGAVSERSDQHDGHGDRCTGLWRYSVRLEWQKGLQARHTSRSRAMSWVTPPSFAFLLMTRSSVGSLAICKVQTVSPASANRMNVRILVHRSVFTKFARPSVRRTALRSAMIQARYLRPVNERDWLSLRPA